MAEAAEDMNPPPAEILDAAAARMIHSKAYPPNVLIVDLEGFQLTKDFYVLGFLQSNHHDVLDMSIQPTL